MKKSVLKKIPHFRCYPIKKNLASEANKEVIRGQFLNIGFTYLTNAGLPAKFLGGLGHNQYTTIAFHSTLATATAETEVYHRFLILTKADCLFRAGFLTEVTVHPQCCLATARKQGNRLPLSSLLTTQSSRWADINALSTKVTTTIRKVQYRTARKNLFLLIGLSQHSHWALINALITSCVEETFLEFESGQG